MRDSRVNEYSYEALHVMRTNFKITHSELRARYHYNPETGVFTRRVQMGPYRAGTETGFVKTSSTGNRALFLKIGFDEYSAAKVAWFYMTGKWPKHKVLKHNKDATDIRWANLYRKGGGNPHVIPDVPSFL